MTVSLYDEFIFYISLPSDIEESSQNAPEYLFIFKSRFILRKKLTLLKYLSFLNLKTFFYFIFQGKLLKDYNAFFSGRRII